MRIFNTMKIYRRACLRMLLACTVMIVGSTHKGESAEAYMRRRLPQVFQQSDDLARKAIEAAKKGDVTTSQQHLNTIETLSPYPRIKNAIQSSSLVQEAKNTHLQAQQTAIRVAAQKAEEEKRANEKEIANRIAFEKERAQKEISQKQEDEKKAVLRQQQIQPRVQQAIPDASVPQTSQALTHQDGKSFASSLMVGVTGAAKSTNLQNVPGFQTDKPKEASLKPEALGDAVLAESRTNSLSQHVTSSAHNRPTFKFDPNTDPLFVDANQVIKNPQSTLSEEIREVSGSDTIFEETKTCEEGGDEYQQTCTKRLEIVLKITPEVRTNVTYCPGHAKKERKGWSLHYSHWTEYCGGCATKVNVTPKKVEVLREQWIDGCGLLEDHVEKGFCRYLSTYQSPKTDSSGNETRMIQGEPVTRDHFEEHYNYACSKSSQKSCAGLREQGCYQIKSVCKEKTADHCVLWEQTFSCPSGKRSLKFYQSSNKESPFCLTGNCADTSYEANNEMMNAMSHLYALREAQNDLRTLKSSLRGNIGGVRATA